MVVMISVVDSAMLSSEVLAAVVSQRNSSTMMFIDLEVGSMVVMMIVLEFSIVNGQIGSVVCL
jgi:hypothetical protein